jgi:hypothetical protein
LRVSPAFFGSIARRLQQELTMRCTRLTRRIIAAISLALVLSVPPLLRATPPGTLAPTVPFVQFTGHDSQRTKPGFFLVRADQPWRRLWAEHSGKPTDEGMSMARHLAPKIDFDRCIVIAYFAGSTANSDGAVVEEVRESGEALTVRFIDATFQTAGQDGRGGAVDVNPYAFWVLPTTTKPIVIEEGNYSSKRDPVRWKEVHRFEAK